MHLIGPCVYHKWSSELFFRIIWSNSVWEWPLHHWLQLKLFELITILTLHHRFVWHLWPCSLKLISYVFHHVLIRIQTEINKHTYTHMLFVLDLGKLLGKLYLGEFFSKWDPETSCAGHVQKTLGWLQQTTEPVSRLHKRCSWNWTGLDLGLVPLLGVGGVEMYKNRLI